LIHFYKSKMGWLTVCLVGMLLASAKSMPLEEEVEVENQDEVREIFTRLFVEGREGRDLEMEMDNEIEDEEEGESKAIEGAIQETNVQEISRFNNYIDAIYKRMNAALRAKLMDPMVLNLQGKDKKESSEKKDKDAKKRVERDVEESDDNEAVDADEEEMEIEMEAEKEAETELEHRVGEPKANKKGNKNKEKKEKREKNKKKDVKDKTKKKEKKNKEGKDEKKSAAKQKRKEEKEKTKKEKEKAKKLKEEAKAAKAAKKLARAEKKESKAAKKNDDQARESRSRDHGKHHNTKTDHGQHHNKRNGGKSLKKDSNGTKKEKNGKKGRKDNKTKKDQGKDKKDKKSKGKGSKARENKKDQKDQKESKVMGSLAGIATLRRSGDVTVMDEENHKVVTSSFTVGPLQLEVSKTLGQGKSRTVKTAKATTDVMSGTMILKVKPDGSAHVKKVVFAKPENVDVKGSLSADKPRSITYLKNSVNRMRPIAAQKILKTARYVLKAPATVKQ